MRYAVLLLALCLACRDTTAPLNCNYHEDHTTVIYGHQYKDSVMTPAGLVPRRDTVYIDSLSVVRYWNTTPECDAKYKEM